MANSQQFFLWQIEQFRSRWTKSRIFYYLHWSFRILVSRLGQEDLTVSPSLHPTARVTDLRWIARGTLLIPDQWTSQPVIEQPTIPVRAHAVPLLLTPHPWAVNIAIKDEEWQLPRGNHFKRVFYSKSSVNIRLGFPHENRRQAGIARWLTFVVVGFNPVDYYGDNLHEGGGERERRGTIISKLIQMQMFDSSAWIRSRSSLKEEEKDEQKEFCVIRNGNSMIGK